MPLRQPLVGLHKCCPIIRMDLAVFGAHFSAILKVNKKFKTWSLLVRDSPDPIKEVKEKLGFAVHESPTNHKDKLQ